MSRDSMEPSEADESDGYSDSEGDPQHSDEDGDSALNEAPEYEQSQARRQASNGSSGHVELVHDDTSEERTDAAHEKDADLRDLEQDDLDRQLQIEGPAEGDAPDVVMPACGPLGMQPQFCSIAGRIAGPRPSLALAAGVDTNPDVGIKGQYPSVRDLNARSTRSAEAPAELSVAGTPAEPEFHAAFQDSITPPANRKQDDTIRLGTDDLHRLSAERREPEGATTVQDVFIAKRLDTRSNEHRLSSLQSGSPSTSRDAVTEGVSSQQNGPVPFLTGELPTPDATIETLRSARHYHRQPHSELEPSKMNARVHSSSWTSQARQESGHLLARLDRIELSLGQGYPPVNGSARTAAPPSEAAMGRARLWSQVDVRSATYEEPRVIRMPARGVWDVSALASQTAARANSLGDTVSKWKGWSRTQTPLRRGQAGPQNGPDQVGMQPVGTTPLRAAGRDMGESSASAKKRRRV
jgi:hypothetical protein